MNSCSLFYQPKHYFDLNAIRIVCSIIASPLYCQNLLEFGFKLVTPFEQICRLHDVNHMIIEPAEKSQNKDIDSAYFNLLKSISNYQESFLHSGLNSLDSLNNSLAYCEGELSIVSDFCPTQFKVAYENSHYAFSKAPLNIVLLKDNNDLKHLQVILSSFKHDGKSLDLCIFAKMRSCQIYQILSPASESWVGFSLIPALNQKNITSLSMKQYEGTILRY